ncbi:MAG TPA: histidine kinase dimerization/phospho-acceptor domain-containing protein, partial [Gemmataceae bacterium]|nr:histidine kinase dimerization/phospho-acceptor domain-containing protein [Gemmataceae bacterium]
MRSIRLWLMVCFLGLLAVALLTASLLVYRNAEQTLAAKQQATEQLIEAQYRERCQEENARLDNALREQAQSLARLVTLQLDWSRADKVQPLFLLGMLTAQQGAYVPAMTWMAESLRPPPPPRDEMRPPEGRRGEPRRPDPPNPLFRELRWRLLTGVKLKEEVLLPVDSFVSDYFQIDYPPGKPYRSHSMGDQSFPLDVSAFPPDQLISAVYDNRAIGNKTRVRRVVLKASNVDMVTYPGLRGGPPRRRDSSRSSGLRPGPTIYVHCAALTDNRDVALAGLLDRRNEEMAAVQAQTDSSLRELRNRLLAISLAVFVATSIGGFWLVHLGLSPLQRVTDAVSRVSTKDFRLPLDDRPLPRELRPIVEHLCTTLDLLKRAFAREKQAAADISHELRTPLAALMTTTEFALRKPRSAEQYRELLHDVHASAQQMHQIVDRLLTLARLDAGVDRLRVQSVDVATLAKQCAGVVRPLSEARGLTLTVKCARGADATPLAASDGAGER